MIEILRFIFSSFWLWAGTVVLLAVIVTGVTAVFEGSLKALGLMFALGRKE